MKAGILFLCWFLVSVTAAPKLDERNDAMCTTCQTIITLLKGELLNPKDRSVVEKRIIELCQKIPAEEISQGVSKFIVKIN
ncbi:hypothetical protein EG68_06215 [Paragonimus skrjabini miyazakii]|uniref:Saposin B-type domain-containing protein n=1 Tax=Paragonimus skrjabini miyazakii TaxID=59628 RepID=A0A8S9YQI9_9TREM|nr:hypothetical protein EG68_06215 [Paragonimus skrjabini miyazakii]